MTSLPTFVSGCMAFPADHPLFADHFPGDPVTPGSLLINAFLQEARRRWPDCRLAGARNFRFRHFVRPGSYTYTLEREGQVLRCTLRDKKGLRLVSGELYG